MEKKVKRKINIKGFLFLLLIVYLVGSLVYYLFTMPLKNILTEGNNYITDEQIINEAGLSDYPNIFKISILKIKKNLGEDPRINTITIHKNILGKITIIITENKPLFYNTLTGKLVLANNKTMDYDNKQLGIPTLINYVPTDVYNDLINGLANIDDNILKSISEIEYSPDKSGEIVFDEARFILRMNDGNIVYINTPNISKLNNYNAIYAEVGSKGTLYLDSSSENYIFQK